VEVQPVSKAEQQQGEALSRTPAVEGGSECEGVSPGGRLPSDPALQAFYQRVTPPGLEPAAFIPFWPSAWRDLQREETSS
jgi:hypothetical protein